MRKADKGPRENPMYLFQYDEKKTAEVNVLYMYIFLLTKVSISIRAWYNGDIAFNGIKYSGKRKCRI